MNTEKLQRILSRIDGRGYKAYKDLQGSYKIGIFTLHIDHVQSDPFAPPSRMRITLSQERAGFPSRLFNSPPRKRALEDYLTRAFYKECIKVAKRKGTGSSGIISIDVGGQEILERTSAKVDEREVEIRFVVGLPAAGRRILSREAETILIHILPEMVSRSLLYRNLPQGELERFVYLCEDQEYLRAKLKEKALVAFVANGSILPRESGISDRPLTGKGVKRFSSPPELEVEFDLPNNGKIRGMGIPQGITLIVGGGYHGKSTLLKAIERGVYNHIPSDGREFVITVEDAVKIRAEDGRFVTHVDISPFISNLPGGVDTTNFSTQNASGSTSQAANIMEALESGTSLLLMDEDTCATNFMIRDGRMQKLVSKECEPITPFIDRIKDLYEKHRVSTILVLGGSGDYFEVANRVLMLREYEVHDVTERAKEIAKELTNYRETENTTPFEGIKRRYISPSSFSLGPRDKIKAKGLHNIIVGRSNIDLSFVEQIVDSSQTNAIAFIIQFLTKNLNTRTTLDKAIDNVLNLIRTKGLEAISPHRGHPGALALPRKYEILAALSRYRGIKLA